MSLLEAIKDLCYRFHVVETEYNGKINIITANIENKNEQYNKLKGKEPNLWLQSLILLLMVPFVMSFGTYLINGEKLENPKAFAILMGIITVATILFNIIRAKASYTLRKKSAESWWEAEGKEAVILLRQALDRIIDKGNSYLSENPLLYEIPESYRTEDDCYALYKIILQRRAFSIEEALSVYADDITAQHQRWLEKYEADKRWEEFSERQEEMQRTLEQTRQELAFADYLIDDIRIHQKYGD